MRKERLIVPILTTLAVLWMAAQLLSSILFERSLTQALEDLEARGEWRVTRTDNRQGWLNSHGTLLLSPLLGRPWRLELTYHARHGLLSTDVEGTLLPLLDSALQRAVGEVSAPSIPRWNGRYHTLSGQSELRLSLAPFIIQQNGRELEVQGARVRLEGLFGDWRLRLMLDRLTLTDGLSSLTLGPTTLQSRYTYIDDAYHFSQYDHLTIDTLNLVYPAFELSAAPIDVISRTTLDEQELRINGELTLGDVLVPSEAPETPLLRGHAEMELSRLNADAVRGIITRLRQEAAWGDDSMPMAEGLLARLAPNLRELFKDSPRLDVSTLTLDSPLLGIELAADGALFFDARRLEALDAAKLGDDAEQARWRRRLDGDFIWHDAPPVVALWLGLPLGTKELQFDIVQGQWRVNGRPLPALLP
ncbi:YdgA family protein [Halomonas dongshanensis]|uniref:YdgA family protein n=1 Tax=Halomonas dongshanensis TaxID=2890835 RepID=A0ABT2EBD1_9GAMM|nr:YdgA family protein [Halomonas dongshanensis]MCS2608888.1 YdgA family protein [Halomonas dongshanensis]